MLYEGETNLNEVICTPCCECVTIVKFRTNIHRPTVHFKVEMIENSLVVGLEGKLMIFIINLINFCLFQGKKN